MKTFTEEEVDKMIRSTMQECVEGTKEWFIKETDVVDKNTGEILPETELKLKPNNKSIFVEYIYPRLEKHGIKFTNK